MKQLLDQISNWLKTEWPKVVIPALATILVTAGALSARDWIRAAVKDTMYEEKFQRNMMDRLAGKVVGLSYQAHFTLEKKGYLEYFIPIYAPKDKQVKLYLKIFHNGPQNQQLRKVDLYIDSIKVSVNLNKDSPYIKEINLDDSLKEAQKLTDHDFSESLHEIVFRADPTQQTGDVVTISALVNVIGLPAVSE